MVHIGTVYVPDNRHLCPHIPIHPHARATQLIHCSNKSFIRLRSRFLLWKTPKDGQLGEHVGQLNIGFFDDLPAFKNVFPYGSRITRTQDYFSFCVVDVFLRILSNIYQHIPQHDITFRCHKRWQDPLCVLISLLFGDLAIHRENLDLFVLPTVGIANLADKVGMYFHFMDLSAEWTRYAV